MRDKSNYRAANGRAQAACSALFACPRRGQIFNTGGGFPTDPPQEGPGASLNLVSGRRNSMGGQSIGIHANGMGTIPMECIRNGMDWYAMH